jgi:DNA modification methylase
MTFEIRQGDCLQVMRTFVDDAFDCVITDPPYGIGKADWDANFATHWMSEVPRIARRLALLPGVWNILKCPQQIGELQYKWTLAAHLTNGMTRGAMGFGNWIPCLVYERKVLRQDVIDWCSAFADWCDNAGVNRQRLNEVTDTSDMGGWWASRLPHRCAVPSREQWERIKAALNPPDEFDCLVSPSDYEPIGDCRDFVIGRERKPDHPSPKPLNVMQWIVESVSKRGDLILDPFHGSGTTGVACLASGRRYTGIELNPEYIRMSERRLSEVQVRLF